MRNENGKGTVKWIIVICLIIVVVFAIVHYVIGIIKREKAKELQADLLLVQANVEIVKGKNNVNKDENPLKGIQLSKIGEKVNIKKVLEKQGISADDSAKYFVLRNSDLSGMDLQELVGKNKGTYIVNYENFEVIYSAGYENVNGLWCYKVSELNKQPEVQRVVPVVSNNAQDNTDTTNNVAEEQNTTAENQSNNAETNNNANEENKTIQIENAEEKRTHIINKWKNLIK